MARWWFQTFFILTPTWGNHPIWRAYFSNGWLNHQLDGLLSERPWTLEWPQRTPSLEFQLQPGRIWYFFVYGQLQHETALSRKIQKKRFLPKVAWRSLKNRGVLVKSTGLRHVEGLAGTILLGHHVRWNDDICEEMFILVQWGIKFDIDFYVFQWKAVLCFTNIHAFS